MLSNQVKIYDQQQLFSFRRSFSWARPQAVTQGYRLHILRYEDGWSAWCGRRLTAPPAAPMDAEDICALCARNIIAYSARSDQEARRV